MSDKKPLSQYGIGPYYAALTFGVTLAALLMNHFGILPVLQVQSAKLLVRLLGDFCIAIGAVMWFNAVIVMNIGGHIRKNELVTSGAYAWVRNPIYSAIMLVLWGLLLWSGNLLLLVLCPVYYLLMTVMVKSTEEKWLTDLYGAEYLAYCERVNRCIPWFPRKEKG